MSESKSLDRDQLLAKLHSISFCAFLTVLTAEECLEVEIMTSKGTCYSWIGYDDWKVCCVSREESAKLSKISEMIADKKLPKEALEDTCFYFLATVAESENLWDLFSDFFEKGVVPGKVFYCFYDEFEERYKFFSSQKALAAALNQYYADVDSSWEDMDTNELSQWLARYETEGGSIPFRYIGDDE